MNNVEHLKAFVNSCKPGDTIEIATSDYASNTTAPGHRFDFHSTAPAVCSLIKQGWLQGECRWRYYEVKVLARPSFMNDGNAADKKFSRAYDLAQTARDILANLSCDKDATEVERDNLAQFADDLMNACDNFNLRN